MKYDVKTYLEAVRLGHIAHAEQRYGALPYTRHLAHVENVLSRFGVYDDEMHAAAWLHDAVEDNASVTMEDVRRYCGDGVAALVEAVTDGEGRNRAERKQASYSKMLDTPKAIALKLADRTANVESCLYDNNTRVGLLDMYRKEHAHFRETLYAASLTVSNFHSRVWSMWLYLDGLLARV
jgi:(p)ppGpp synthase/HD superfamily hydrolase